ncbi:MULTISPECIES: enoyl-CoA hydratase/isomerase family protein [Burkholderia]|uniref:Enoyl-CoA hydratase n=1 Tax=Burkholderia aenigmatica TaxID=2015348 RepID=A0ABY6XYJ6_9BURK|nr:MULTISPECIES: enoyl-CoA hydratase/isomerase family protein [Burkholderia]VWD05394.1 enoyl-CoA hydratase [Burkholderia aenigmatica]VWD08817.1 enoyl-CoA hydratase [Burkholderia aenigmatica]
MNTQVPAVLTAHRSGAIWMTLNRAEAMNAISPEIIQRLMRGLDLAETASDVHAVVLTGTGRAFCAGADLKFVRGTADADGAGRFLADFLVLLNRLETFPKPVIGAINGAALAGGLELILCCDLVVAARSATFGDAHANYGLLPGGGGSVRLPRKIGPTRTKYLMFTGEFVSAEYMQSAGLVNEVTDDAELSQAVGRIVAAIAAKSPIGLARMKALVNDGLQQPMEVALRQELLMSALHEHSHDMREGLAAFAEKRIPRFAGH